MRGETGSIMLESLPCGLEKELTDASELRVAPGLSLHIVKGSGVVFCARISGERCRPRTRLNARS